MLNKKIVNPARSEILQKYLPESSIPLINKWFNEYKFQLRISRSRLTKLGDYSHPHKGKTHRISVNHNLNSYSFLVTLVHEIAHLTTFNKFGNKVNPHGKEWKEEFRIHLKPVFDLNILPSDIFGILNQYSINPKASTCTDLNLVKVLKKYDTNSEYVHLEDIPEKSIFRLRNGRSFIKGARLRKRFKCVELNGKKNFLISPVAEVIQTSLF